MTEYLSCFKRNILSYCTVLADVLYLVQWTLQYIYKHIVMGYNQDYGVGRQTETVHIMYNWPLIKTMVLVDRQRQYIL